jgi:hypothetical protein
MGTWIKDLPSFSNGPGRTVHTDAPYSSVLVAAVIEIFHALPSVTGPVSPMLQVPQASIPVALTPQYLSAHIDSGKK